MAGTRLRASRPCQLGRRNSEPEDPHGFVGTGHGGTFVEEPRIQNLIKVGDGDHNGLHNFIGARLARLRHHLNVVRKVEPGLQATTVKLRPAVLARLNGDVPKTLPPPTAEARFLQIGGLDGGNKIGFGRIHEVIEGPHTARGQFPRDSDSVLALAQSGNAAVPGHPEGDSPAELANDGVPRVIRIVRFPADLLVDLPIPGDVREELRLRNKGVAIALEPIFGHELLKLANCRRHTIFHIFLSFCFS